MKKRVLVVEDDPVLARVLHDNLAFDGFEVSVVSDGRVAHNAVRDFAPDLVLLDINLPGRSGLELCEQWRRGSRTPIIFVTAMSQKRDKVHGLKIGADDYITKPFDLEELRARIHAVLRRSRPEVSRLVLGRVTIHFTKLTAWDGTREIEMTHREFELLQYLAERPNCIVRRDELLRVVWGYPDTAHTRAVDHAIARLRKKIEVQPQKPRFIHTVHGDGYYLAPDGDEGPGPQKPSPS